MYESKLIPKLNRSEKQLELKDSKLGGIWICLGYELYGRYCFPTVKFKAMRISFLIPSFLLRNEQMHIEKNFLTELFVYRGESRASISALDGLDLNLDRSKPKQPRFLRCSRFLRCGRGPHKVCLNPSRLCRTFCQGF